MPKTCNCINFRTYKNLNFPGFLMLKARNRGLLKTVSIKKPYKKLVCLRSKSGQMQGSKVFSFPAAAETSVSQD